MARTSNIVKSRITTLFVALVVSLPSLAAAQAEAPKETLKAWRPDLVIAAAKFNVVKNSTAADGSPCQIYNLTVSVRNKGDGGTGPFTIRIERQKGDGSAPFELACQTCEWNVTGLRAGHFKDFPPRQFNNCGNNWNRFRIFVDYYDKVAESDEGNNTKVVRYGPRLIRRPVVH